MAGYCTQCGGSGFRKPSIERELEELGPYVRNALAAGPIATGRELLRLQRKLAAYADLPGAIERADNMGAARHAARLAQAKAHAADRPPTG